MSEEVAEQYWKLKTRRWEEISGTEYDNQSDKNLEKHYITEKRIVQGNRS